MPRLMEAPADDAAYRSFVMALAAPASAKPSNLDRALRCDGSGGRRCAYHPRRTVGFAAEIVGELAPGGARGRGDRDGRGTGTGPGETRPRRSGWASLGVSRPQGPGQWVGRRPHARCFGNDRFGPRHRRPEGHGSETPRPCRLRLSNAPRASVAQPDSTAMRRSTRMI